MSADATHATVCTHPLQANTSASLALTGPGRTVEFCHHSDNSSVVYYDVRNAEGSALTGGGTQGERVLLAGERLQVNAPRRGSGGIWVELISAGTPTVTVELINNAG